MSNALTELRERLKTALESADLNAFHIVPEKATPPLAWAGPSDPYVTGEGASYGCILVRHEITIAAGKGVNEVIAAQVDDMLLKVLGLIPDDFAVEATTVGRVEVNGQRYLGAVVNLLTEIQLPEETP